jgi:hypothetical protein
LLESLSPVLRSQAQHPHLHPQKNLMIQYLRQSLPHYCHACASSYWPASPLLPRRQRRFNHSVCIELTFGSFFPLLVVFKPFGIFLVDLEVLAEIHTTSLTLRAARVIIAEKYLCHVAECDSNSNSMNSRCVPQNISICFNFFSAMTPIGSDQARMKEAWTQLIPPAIMQVPSQALRARLGPVDDGRKGFHVESTALCTCAWYGVQPAQ